MGREGLLKVLSSPGFCRFTKARREFHLPDQISWPWPSSWDCGAHFKGFLWKMMVLCSLLHQRLLKCPPLPQKCIHILFSSHNAGLSFISEERKSGPCPLGFTVLEKRSWCHRIWRNFWQREVGAKTYPATKWSHRFQDYCCICLSQKQSLMWAWEWERLGESVFFPSWLAQLRLVKFQTPGMRETLW